MKLKSRLVLGFAPRMLVTLLLFMQSGCNWSPPTLALKAETTPGSVTVANKPAPASSVAEIPAVDSPAAVTESGEPDESVEVTSDVPQPKLAHVDIKRLIGRWRDSFFGERTLTLNADGTGRMELDLDFAGRLLYGKRLDFEMSWVVKGGVVSIEILDGHPSDVAKSAISAWGKSHKYLLDCVEENQVAMRDSTGKLNYRLTRLTADE